MRIRQVSDLSECERLWKAFFPPGRIWDLWEFRLCFHSHFKTTPCFLVLEDAAGVAGLLPLCRMAQTDTHVFFPGETWKGLTWLERTPFYARDARCLQELLLACPSRSYLRYMEIPAGFCLPGLSVDETGYVLFPSRMEGGLGAYHGRFPRKKIKSILKDIERVAGPESSFTEGRTQDFDLLVSMSLSAFGPKSYFFDERFTRGFADAQKYLLANGLLRMTSLQKKGKTLAVDMGCVYQGVYTLLAGGTDPEVLGVAKAMNMHHVEVSCREKFSKVDFLCGDFNWKKLWHLDAEPLYKYVTPAPDAPRAPEGPCA